MSQPSSEVSSRTPRAYLHVGAPKTGTTYLQGVLWRNKAALRDAGVHVLGGNRNDHYRAGHDLRDIPFDPDDPRVDWTGAWDLMCRLAGSSSAPSVVISDEHLASLSSEQVRRAVEGLRPREVHVVYASRGLAGLLPSEWQEYVKHGSKLDYATWSRRVLSTPRKGPGRWFWSVHDPVGVVRRWSSMVPLENIHVITMPPSDAPKDELWHRFASVLDVDPTVAVDFDVAGNLSLGVAETEVLRQVNQHLPENFPRWHYIALVRDLLAVKVLGAAPSTTRPVLPDDLEEVVRRRATRAIKGLKASGCHIVGDIKDLRPRDSSSRRSNEVSCEDELETSTAALASLIVHLAQRRDADRDLDSGMRHRLQATGSVRRLRGRFVGYAEGNKLLASVGRRLGMTRPDAEAKSS